MNPDAPGRSPRARVDFRHQTLLTLLDRILQLSREGALTTDFEEAVLRFAEQFTDHAAGEQDLMHAVRYPSLEPHAAAHDALLLAVVSLLPAPFQAPPTDILDRARALELEVQQHIITWDWNLLDFVRKVRPQIES